MSASPKFRTILIVDDDESDRLIAGFAIRKYAPRCKISEAIDGQSALALLDEADRAAPDLIIVDINMPGMDGFEFLEHYSQRDDAVPVVTMVSSSGADRDRDRCAAFDCVIGYLTKPLESEDLQTLDAERSRRSS